MVHVLLNNHEWPLDLLPRLASSGYASGVQHLIDPGIHFIFFDELSSIRLSDTLLHGGTKAGILFQEPQGGILHQMLGISSGMARELRELCFLFRREVNFHSALNLRIARF